MVDMDALADVVAQAIDTATAPLLARIAVLEKRGVLHGRDGRDGKDAPLIDVDALAAKAAALIPTPRDGRDATPVDVDALAVKAAALIPVPRYGRDGKDGVLPAFDLDAAVARALESRAVEDLVTKRIWPVLQKELPAPKEGSPGAEGPAGKEGPAGRDGRDGKDFDPAVVLELKSEIASLRTELLTKSVQPSSSELVSTIQSMVRAEVATLPAPKDGKDGTSVEADTVEALIVKAVNMTVATLPPAKDGRDGKDGRDVDPAALEVIVAGYVEKALGTWPKPQDGRSVTVQDVAPLIEAAVTKAVAALPKAADGVGVSDAVIDRRGELVLTFSDGRTKSVGVVVGADADPAEVSRVIGEAIAAFPRPKDGVDGKDGLGFDDMDVVDDGERCALRLSRDGKVKQFVIPIAVDRGTYRPGKRYCKGALVTAQGSLWCAQSDTAERPGDGATSWRLAVKKGRDGKDYVPDGSQS